MCNYWHNTDNSIQLINPSKACPRELNSVGKDNA